MFTLNHLLWVLLSFAIIGSLLFVSLKFRFSFKTATLTVSLISIASELFKIFTHIDDVTEDGAVVGGVLGPEFLPLHLCSILIFVIFYLNFAKNEKTIEMLKSIVVPVAFLGAIMTFIIPTSGVNFLKPYAYQAFVYHAGIFWYALYLIVTKQVRLNIKTYGKNMAILASVVFAMLWVNSALSQYGTNFFYVVKPPMDNLPILNLNHGWTVYFFSLLATGFVLFTLFHLPFIIIDKIKDKNS